MKTMTSSVLCVAVLASLTTVVLAKPVNTGTGVGAAISRLQAWNGFVSQLEMLQTAIPERLYSKLVADLLQALARADTDALQRLLQATSPDSTTDGIEGEGRGGIDLLAVLDKFLQTKRTPHKHKHHTLPNEDEETAEVVGMFDRLTSGNKEDRIHVEEDQEAADVNHHGRTKRMVEVLLSGDREREAARQEETEVERMIRRLVAEASGMILYTLMSDSLAELQPGQS
ncbi:uncharacterized protein LOC144868985 [Branchiostoma floridae x Branchiostoma japonicum]